MSLSTDSCLILRKKGKALSAADMKKSRMYTQIDYNSDDPKKSDWIRFQNQKDTDPVQCFYLFQSPETEFSRRRETTVQLYLPRYLSIKASIMQGRTKCWKWAVSKTGFPHVLQQMPGEESHGLDNLKAAYEAGLFQFQ